MTKDTLATYMKEMQSQSIPLYFTMKEWNKIAKLSPREFVYNFNKKFNQRTYGSKVSTDKKVVAILRWN